VILCNVKLSIVNATSKDRPCLKGIVELETPDNWAAFSVFGFTRNEVYERGYAQADLWCKEHGCRLETFKVLDV
jgi:hypothetical protein